MLYRTLGGGGCRPFAHCLIAADSLLDHKTTSGSGGRMMMPCLKQECSLDELTTTAVAAAAEGQSRHGSGLAWVCPTWSDVRHSTQLYCAESHDRHFRHGQPATFVPGAFFIEAGGLWRSLVGVTVDQYATMELADGSRRGQVS